MCSCNKKKVVTTPFNGVVYSTSRPISGERFQISTSEEVMINGFKLRAGGITIVYQSQFDELIERGAKVWRL